MYIIAGNEVFNTALMVNIYSDGPTIYYRATDGMSPVIKYCDSEEEAKGVMDKIIDGLYDGKEVVEI